MQAECKKCGHEWEETGGGGYYACPGCGTMYARASLPHPHEADEATPGDEPDAPDDAPPVAPVAPPPRKPRPPLAQLDRDDDERPRIPARWLLAGVAVVAACVGAWLVWSWKVKNPGWDLTDEPPRFGVPSTDETLAADYLDLKQRAGWGDAEAQYAMGVRWAHGEDHVHKVDAEGMANADIEAQSREYFVAAARQGYPPAQTVLAVEDGFPMLAHGGPIEEPRRMRDAAAKDYPPAWYVRGLWAIHASDRLEDSAEASVLRHEGLLAVERSARARYAPAEHWTAIAHWCGLHGFDEDQEATATWMTRAAIDGSPQARPQVAELHAWRLAEPSPVEAHAWASVLAEDGAGRGVGPLTEVQSGMADLRAEGRRRQLRGGVGPLPPPRDIPWPRLEDLDCGRARRQAPPSAAVEPTGTPSLVTAEQRRVARDATCGEACVTAWIGPDGGEVALPDGTNLVYAPGAVSGLVEVTLEPVAPVPWDPPAPATRVGAAFRVHAIADDPPEASLRVPVPPGVDHPRAGDFLRVHGEVAGAGGASADGTLGGAGEFKGLGHPATGVASGTVRFPPAIFPSRPVQVFHTPAVPTPVGAAAGEASAYLTINCKPWCTVWLDGRLVRNSPIKHHAIPAGEHHLALRCGPCRSAQILIREFHVAAGETYTSVRNEFER